MWRHAVYFAPHEFPWHILDDLPVSMNRVVEIVRKITQDFICSKGASFSYACIAASVWLRSSLAAMGSQLCTAPRTLHDAAALQAMKAQGVSTTEWTVVLKKYPGASLGMDVDLFEGKSLIIYLVCESGLAAEWNQANPQKLCLNGAV